MSQYSIIVGADQGELPFMVNRALAHVRLPSGSCIYAERPLEGDVMKYQHYNDFLPVPPDAVILARRYFIDFDSMHNNEIDARWHAYKLSRKGDVKYRIVDFDEKARAITWDISPAKQAPYEKTTSWVHEEQAKVSTLDIAEVDALCYEYRISLTVNQDLGEEVMWKAVSPRFSNVVMESPSRSRAVIQLLLLAHYQRNVLSYVSQDTINWILSNHSVSLKVGA